MKDKELEFFESDEFKELFKKQIIKDTWDKDLPMIYIENGKIIKHYKDGRKEIISKKLTEKDLEIKRNGNIPKLIIK